MYQTSQETTYQTIARKALEEKCSEYEKKAQIMIRDANQEIHGMNDFTRTIRKSKGITKGKRN